MFIDDAIALAPTAFGLWDDGWLSANSQLSILVYEPGDMLLIELWIPASFQPRKACLKVGTWSTEMIMIPDETVSVEIPIPPDTKGITVAVEIPNASPATAPDIRTVGAVLAGIRLKRLTHH